MGSRWSGKHAVVLGLARQGKALARYLVEQGAMVVVSDRKSAEAMQAAVAELDGFRLDFVFGGHPASLIEGADLLCLSGGIPADLPLAQQARAQGIRVLNDSQIFLEDSPAPVIGITGSAGKSTTTALVGRMAAATFAGQGRRAWVGGNIGRPLVADLASIQAADLVIMELSSFQLELMTISPHVAAVLNLTPNHLNRHRTMLAYGEAKAHILDFQGADDIAVLNRDDPGAWAMRQRVRGGLVTFGNDADGLEEGSYLLEGAIWLHLQGETRQVLAVDEVELRGAHNLSNVLAACAIAGAAGLPLEALRAGVVGFRGIPHRLEFVREANGVAWYNDSIATAPERAAAAIRSFDEPLVLLAGGRDKDLPWDSFGRLVARRVDHLIVFGEAADKVLAAVSAAGGPQPHTIDRCQSLEEAVHVAALRAQSGDVVLLAPGGTSFDAYLDFEARGEHFKQLVNDL
jgi:UDP-N-acetylmuramoylalanine--D-glutamate ligase